MMVPITSSRTTSGRSHSFFSLFRNTMNSRNSVNRSRTDTLSGTRGFYRDAAGPNKARDACAEPGHAPGERGKAGQVDHHGRAFWWLGNGRTPRNDGAGVEPGAIGSALADHPRAEREVREA